MADVHAWWADLRHGGLLISPAVLAEWLPQAPPDPAVGRCERVVHSGQRWHTG